MFGPLGKYALKDQAFIPSERPRVEEGGVPFRGGASETTGAALRTISRQVVTYPFIKLRNSPSAELKGGGVFVCNTLGSIVPLGVSSE